MAVWYFTGYIWTLYTHRPKQPQHLRYPICMAKLFTTMSYKSDMTWAERDTVAVKKKKNVRSVTVVQV